jgi:hypothetical protein
MILILSILALSLNPNDFKDSGGILDSSATRSAVQRGRVLVRFQGTIRWERVASDAFCGMIETKQSCQYPPPWSQLDTPSEYSDIAQSGGKRQGYNI